VSLTALLPSPDLVKLRSVATIGFLHSTLDEDLFPIFLSCEPPGVDVDTGTCLFISKSIKAKSVRLRS
jgi:hypothetical protein